MWMLLPCHDHFWNRYFQRLFVCSLSVLLCRVWVLMEVGRYEQALRSQPALDILQSDAVKAVAAALFLGGNLLVLTSMWALGFTGTYLGMPRS
jgi:methylene-fatty-acyl-phospholipid synthase